MTMKKLRGKREQVVCKYDGGHEMPMALTVTHLIPNFNRKIDVKWPELTV